MDKKEKLNKINNELKVYINEANFISVKCRDKLLKFLCEEFYVKLDINRYANVDVKINEDGSILYRDDIYKPSIEINSVDDIFDRYDKFNEKAKKLLSRKEIDFNNKSNVNNITNLVIIICLIFIAIAAIILSIFAFFSGRYFDCLWLLFVVIPSFVPSFKENLSNRLIQAKNYLRHLFKKIK